MFAIVTRDNQIVCQTSNKQTFVFTTRAAANKALARVLEEFPEAKIVEITLRVVQ